MLQASRCRMILADNGSPWYLSGAPNGNWDNDALRAGPAHGRRLLGGRRLLLPPGGTELGGRCEATLPPAASRGAQTAVLEAAVAQAPLVTSGPTSSRPPAVSTGSTAWSTVLGAPRDLADPGLVDDVGSPTSRVVLGVSRPR